MAKVALPKVGLVLEERQKKINDSLDMAEDLRIEAQRRRANRRLDRNLRSP